MVTSLITFIFAPLFRRVWGGFCAPSSLLKRLLGFAFPAAIMLSSGQGTWPSAAVAFVIGLAWMNSLHAYGQRMGRGGDPALKKCVYAMAVSYGAYTMLAAFAWYLVGDLQPIVLAYAFAGFLTPIGYLAGWSLKERLGWPESGVCYVRVGQQPNCMIDGPTAIGELWLGAIMLLPLAVIAELAR